MHIRFSRSYLLFLLPLLLQSCMLCSRMDRLVSQHYAKKQALKPVEERANVSVSTQALPRIPGFCRSRYKSFFTIPLLFYTYSNERIRCEVNPKMYAAYSMKQLYKLIDAPENERKLQGKSLELAFKEIPSVFNHSYKNHFVSFNIFLSGLNLSYTTEEGYSPMSWLRVSYVVKDEQNNIIQQGELEHQVANTVMRRSWSQWRKSFIQDFVATFDDNLERSCQQLAEKIFNRL